MPLLDHFHAPLAGARHWESFHGAWAAEIMALLNRSVLPPNYFAEAQVHLGTQIEIDSATFERSDVIPNLGTSNGGVAVLPWSPPLTTLLMPAVFPDDLEVQIFLNQGGPTLVAALELVSPGNKDRQETRRAFAAKCAAYLQRGLGLIVVDVVTDRRANLHDELIDFLGQPEQYEFPGEQPLYAVSYHPQRRNSADHIEMAPYALALGQALPTVPLPLRGGPVLPLNLEATYMETRLRSRL